MLRGATKALMRERVVGGVKDAIARRSRRKENASGRELVKVAGDRQSAVGGDGAHV